MRWLLLAALLTTPALADDAAEPKLPLGLGYCEASGAVEAKLGEVKKLDDDMWDSKAELWGLDGFARVVLEDRKLLEVHLRFFDTEKSRKAARKALIDEFGEGQEKRGGLSWQRGQLQVSLKLEAEEVRIHYELPFGTCADGGVIDLGMTEQAKKDLEASKHRPTVDFDPYADSDDPEKQIVENKKKKAEEKKEAEEQKKREEELDDVEIDW